MSQVRSESSLRAALKRRGFRLEKSRQQIHCNNKGQFNLVDAYTNTILYGGDFDCSLETAQWFLEEVDAGRIGVPGAASKGILEAHST